MKHHALAFRHAYCMVVKNHSDRQFESVVYALQCDAKTLRTVEARDGDRPRREHITF